MIFSIVHLNANAVTYSSVVHLVNQISTKKVICLTMNYITLLTFLASALTLVTSFVLSPSRIHRPNPLGPLMSASDNDIQSRRHVFSTFGQILLTGTFVSSASATDSIVYLTGKSPKVPGEKPKDKSDTKGTKRDSNFRRSISDCKSQCEQKLGPDGYARNKEDCLSECQDVCCTTYEQCTFNITPR